MSSRVPSITAEDDTAAFSKNSSTVGRIVGSTSRMCESEPVARSSIQSKDSQTRAIARTAAMTLLEPKPVRMALRILPPDGRRGRPPPRVRCAGFRSVR
eukprot:6176141-Pleurochrysis_carterae.AAC.3